MRYPLALFIAIRHSIRSPKEHKECTVITVVKQAVISYIKAGQRAHHRKKLNGAYCDGFTMAEIGERQPMPSATLHRAEAAAFRRGFRSSNHRSRKYG